MPGSDELPSDPGETTWARPMGLTVAGDTAYIACGNMDDEYIAGGPGVVVEIDTVSHSVRRFHESGGRNCVNVYHHDGRPDELWILNAGTYEPGSGFAGDGTLAIRSIAGDEVIRVVDLQDSPLELVLGNDRVYFASAMDGRIARMDLDGFTMASPIELPTAGQGINYVSGLEITPDGVLWALEFNHNMLYVLDPAPGQIIQSVPMGEGPDALAFIEKE
jgi:streptogramin lyase